MIHPTVRAEIGEHALTLLAQAAELLETPDDEIQLSVLNRWFAEYREMLAHTDLTAEQEAHLRLLGIIE